MKTKSKFVALIGLGYWGKNILRNLYELRVLHSACDVNSELLKEKKEIYPDINFTLSLEEILKSPEIKAVAVATPSETHYDIAKSILLAGKDVFVEKPLALNSSQGRELVMLAKEQNCILMVGHILHYHSAIIKLKQMITIGKLGQIQYVYSNRLNIGKLSIGENILWSFASHDISILLSLLEEPLINVSAFGEDIINKGIYDTALVNLEFKSGIKGHIFVNWLHPFKEQKLVIVGSIGMAVFDDVSMEKLYFYPHKIETKIGTVPVVHKADYQIIQVDCNESLKEELKHFIDCIINRKKPITDGKEGLKVLEVLEIAENSLKDYKSNKNIKIQKVYYPYNNSHISNNIIFAKDTVI